MKSSRIDQAEERQADVEIDPSPADRARSSFADLPWSEERVSTVESIALHPTVILADDDDALRELLAESLRRLGYSVEECCDGEELRTTLESLESAGTPPDLVISDQRMPRLTGLEVLTWLERSGIKQRFVLLSAFAAPSLREHAHRHGASRVVDKPVDLRELRRLVVEMIGVPAGAPETP
jgi:CheY-like chemotaxis protein